MKLLCIFVGISALILVDSHDTTNPGNISKLLHDEQTNLNNAFHFYQQQYLISLDQLSEKLDRYNDFLLQSHAANVDRFNQIRWYADARLKHINISPSCQHHWLDTTSIYGRQMSGCVEAAKVEVEFIKSEVSGVIVRLQSDYNQVVGLGLQALVHWNPLVDRDVDVTRLIHLELMDHIRRFLNDYEEIEMALEYANTNFDGVTQGFATCIGQFVTSFQYTAQKMIQSAEAAEC